MSKKTKSDELTRAEEALKRAKEAMDVARKERDAADAAYKAANERYWVANNDVEKAKVALLAEKMAPSVIAALRALNKAKDGRIDVPSYTKFWEGPTIQSPTALTRTHLAINQGYKSRTFVITPAGVDWCNAHPEEA